MARMTKAQLRKRLEEAKKKCMTVYVKQTGNPLPVSTADMSAIEKILDKCISRLK